MQERQIHLIDHDEDRLLYDHLLGTCDILSSWGCSADICLAGLCHSLYGTESFEPVPIVSRGDLRKAIGQSAETLVYLYSRVRWDSFWDSIEKSNQRGKFWRLRSRSGDSFRVSSPQLRALIYLALGNALEQWSGKRSALFVQLELVSPARLKGIIRILRRSPHKFSPVLKEMIRASQAE
jgi:hypothetical protein